MLKNIFLKNKAKYGLANIFALEIPDRCLMLAKYTKTWLCFGRYEGLTQYQLVHLLRAHLTRVQLQIYHLVLAHSRRPIKGKFLYEKL